MRCDKRGEAGGGGEKIKAAADSAGYADYNGSYIYGYGRCEKCDRRCASGLKSVNPDMHRD